MYYSVLEYAQTLSAYRTYNIQKYNIYCILYEYIERTKQ